MEFTLGIYESLEGLIFLTHKVYRSRKIAPPKASQFLGAVGSLHETYLLCADKPTHDHTPTHLLIQLSLIKPVLPQP